ncbi:MAG: Rne/Rng family ribonuclease [Elainellaceae cyanobacterium]
MSKQIIIAEQHRIAAVFSEDQIQELIVAKGTHQVGDIYVGTVENVLPSIDAAFVNIGDADRNGFIHVSDLGPIRLKRAMAPITELLAPQQKALVQIMKEPTGNKGPRLTGNISLPGRYLVLMPFGRGVNLSRRIRNEAERNRLRALSILLKPAGMGLLVRTEAEGVPEEAIIEDLEALQLQWETVQQEAETTRPPSLLNRDDDFIQRVLRDVYSADVNRIVADSHPGLKRVKQHLTTWNGGRTPTGVLIDHHRDRTPILDFFRVNAAIREALKPRVDLPSGGYIIIEPTEALTVVDVNSGSFTRSATSRETVLWTNCEAATEIARQLRLRNVAGVIIIDFIDMDARRDQLQVLETFNRELKADKARPQIAQLSELGLVELTRKRQGQNIYELFGKSCPTCGGLGHLVHLPGDATQPTNLVAEPIEHIPQQHKVITVGETREALSTSDRDSAPIKVVADADSNRDAQPVPQERGGQSRRRRRDSGASAAKSIAPVETPTPDEEEKSSANGSKGKSRGEKSDRRERRDRPPEPPEVVVVEMTPQEQEIYALMGISPLVLSTETIKNPKTAIVSVAAPGEQRQVQQMIMADVLQGQKSEPTPSADKSEPSFPVPSRGNRSSSPAPEGDGTPSRKVIQTPSAQAVEESPNLASVSVPDAVNQTEQEPAEAGAAGSDGNGDTGKTRRRRRRSSASST